MSDSDEITSSFIEAARRGDRDAEGEIVRRIRSFARHVWSGALPSTAVEIDWEDVAQEACRKFFSVCLSRYVPGGSENSYLYSVVRVTSLELARKSSRRRNREQTAWSEREELVEANRGSDALRILAKLPEECRTLLEAVYFQGTSYANLAAHFGLAESSIRARVSRCIRKARTIAR